MPAPPTEENEENAVPTSTPRTPASPSTPSTPAAVPRRRDGGPPLPLPIASAAALFTAGVVVAALTADGAGASPFRPDGERLAHLAAAGPGSGAGVAAVLHVAAAVPLAVFGAAVHARLNALGVRVAGAGIAGAGAVLGSAFLGLSGVTGWALSRTDVRAWPGPGLALQDLTFAAGGPVHVAALGLLVAGIAVPGLLLGLLPRPFAVAGLVLAVGCELSLLALLAPAAAYLVPVRFPVLAWLVAAAVLLPRDRRAAVPGAGPAARRGRG